MSHSRGIDEVEFHAGDEGEALLREEFGAAARGAGGRWRLAAGLVSVGLLAGIAVVSLGHASPRAGGANLRVAAVQSLAEDGEPSPASPQVAQKRQDARTKLALEKDLADVVKTMDMPRGATPGDDEASEQIAGQLFDHVTESSGVAGELTENERAAYRSRFVAEMTLQSKEDRGGDLSVEAYLARAGYVLESQKPVVTESLVTSINNANLGFTAKMRDWMVHESKDLFQRRLGRMPLPEEKVQELARQQRQRSLTPKPQTTKLPENFDAREKWPECADVIGRIHNQGHCGSCWAFGALAPLDSRLCIITQKSDSRFDGDMAMLSRGFAASCSTTWDGCQGGYEYLVYDYIEQHAGIPSTACVPYFASGAGSEHFEDSGSAPPCPGECDPQFPRNIWESSFKPSGVGNYTLFHKPTQAELKTFKTAIYQGGPVSFAFYASRAFMSYHSGIFALDCGHEANHAVHAIGWGQGYFMAQNSWGPDWGDEGRFKIAPCVVCDFTIPGDIKPNQWYPLPIPRETRTTTSTTPPPAPDPSTQPCELDEKGCWTSPNFPEDYNNSQTCIISYTFGKIDVIEFDTEEKYDFMKVNGQKYSGSVGPQGVVPVTHIKWTSDTSVTRKGWKICPFAEEAGDDQQV